MKESRSEVVLVRMTPTEKEAFKTRADSLRMSMSAYVMDLHLKAVRGVELRVKEGEK